MIIKNIYSLVGLLISTILILSLLVFIKKQTRQTKVKKSFLMILFFLLIWCLGLIAQITLSDVLDISPIYFDYFVYIGTCFVPVSFLIMSLKFTKPDENINTKKLAFSLSIIPIICLLILWTNSSHNLFYEDYSIILSKGLYGPFFYVTSIYIYLVFGIALYFLAIYSVRNIKFYFWQSLLIFLGAFIPIIVNLGGLIGLVDLSIYVTPICFSITIFCFALSIFRFGFLRITPVTLKNIVNRISDSYVILNHNLIIADFNKTLLNTFYKKNGNEIINKNLFDIKGTFSDFNTFSTDIIDAINKTTNNDNTIVLDKYFEKVNKYFHIEINRISERNSFLGTLILLKDVTQHKIDLETIKNNQDILIEKERLASLGQMIGRNCT